MNPAQIQTHSPAFSIAHAMPSMLLSSLFATPFASRRPLFLSPCLISISLPPQNSEPYFALLFDLTQIYLP
jgi:hypothetical protein